MKRPLLLLLMLLPVSLYAQTSVIVRGKISSANATTSALTNAGVFTGSWELARDYTTLTITVFSDQASAANGLECQWSSDASSVDVVDQYSVSANVGASWTTVTKAAYYRLKYTNGSTTQTEFRLSAILRQSGAPAASASGGGLTDAELRATPVPVSGTVTATPTGTQVVSGTVTANAGSGPWPVTDNGSSITVDGTFWQATQPVSGTVTTSPPANATTNVTQVAGTAVDVNSGLKSSGTQRIVIATDQPQLTNALKVDGSGVTQPVSGTVTANAGSGTLAVSGPVTDTQLRASPVPISGTITANQGGTWTIQPGNTANTTPWLVNARNQAGDGTSIGSGGTGTGLTVTCTNCGGSVTPVTYVWNTPDAVGGANKLHADLFNASGSGKIVKILGIYPTIKTDVGVTGVLGLRWNLYRTSAVGTGGTAAVYKSATMDVAGGSISPRDTTNADLPAQVTARHLPTAGATITEWLQRGQCFVEETNQATYICSGQTDFMWMGTQPEQPITLREGQGLLIKQGAVATVNNIAFRIVFSLE